MCFGLNDIGKFPAKRPCGPVNLYNDLVSGVSRRTGRRIVAEFCRRRKRVGDGELGVRNGELGVRKLLPHSPFPAPHSPSYQRQRHVLLVVSLSLIAKTRPALTTAMPDLAWAIGLMLTRANTLSARSVTRLPTRVV